MIKLTHLALIIALGGSRICTTHAATTHFTVTLRVVSSCTIRTTHHHPHAHCASRHTIHPRILSFTDPRQPCTHDCLVYF